MTDVRRGHAITEAYNRLMRKVDEAQKRDLVTVDTLDLYLLLDCMGAMATAIHEETQRAFEEEAHKTDWS